MKLIGFIGILVILALLFGIVPASSALAAEDNVTGSFTPANVTPNVTALNVYSGALPVTDLTPQAYYSVNVTAGDGNTIEDIDELHIKLYYDAGDLDPNPPDTGDEQTCAVLEWDKDGGASEWTIEAGGSGTWAILSANCTKPSNFDVPSGEWIFVIQIGTVATETFPNGDNWDLFGEAVDGSGTGNYTSPNEKEVLWYGEISTNATAPFGTVENDSGFADNTNEVNNVSVNYVCNGAYDQRVKSDATWNGTSFTADYDSTGVCDDQQEFSLRAYVTDTFLSSVQVDTVGVSIDNTGTQTDEGGFDVNTNTLWLRIALYFSMDTYSGNIVYIIADN